MINYQLLIHNVLFLGGGIINVLIALVILYIRRKDLNNLVMTFILMTLSVAVFQISQVLGANAATAELSRQYFMFNLVNIPINVFMAHWFLALIGKTRERRTILAFIYASGIVLLVYYLLYPDTFLLESVPKMYFPFYYNPGSLYWLMRVWFNVIGAYYFVEILLAWRREIDPIKRNRYLYVTLAILYGFVVGSSAVLLVYNIQFDPMWASFFSLYIVLIAYTVVRYQLLDVKVIIQRAFVYAVSVTILIGFISFNNTLNVLIQNIIPGFPAYIVPILWSLVGVAVGIVIWKKLREGDILKYEFITIIAHKFRTPLTQVKWTAEELLLKERDQDVRNGLRNITVSNEKLIALTGTLVELAGTDSSMHAFYAFKKASVCELVKSTYLTFKNQFEKKNIAFLVQCPSLDMYANIDEERMRFVLQTLIENSYAYTPSGGKVMITASSSGQRAYIAVSDNGIGIRENDIMHIFSKFYRGHSGRSTDTEGFGVGLYLAQSIAKRHGGKIVVFSEGPGKGSTFTVSFPLAYHQ